MPLLVLLRMAAMARFHLFHGYWRYSGISDAVDVVKAVLLGSLAFLVVERWVLRQASLPISFYFLEAMLTGLALGGIRILSRVWIQRSERRAKWQTAKSVVVVGAGCGAAMLLRELPRSGYPPSRWLMTILPKPTWPSMGFGLRVRSPLCHMLSIVTIPTR